MAVNMVRFGTAKAVGTTYTSLGAGTSGKTYHLRLHMTNITTDDIAVRAYVADPTWASGEPAGSTLTYTIVKDVTIPPGMTLSLEVFLSGTEDLVVRSDTASSLDAVAGGVSES